MIKIICMISAASLFTSSPIDREVLHERCHRSQPVQTDEQVVEIEKRTEYDANGVYVEQQWRIKQTRRKRIENDKCVDNKTGILLTFVELVLSLLRLRPHRH